MCQHPLAKALFLTFKELFATSDIMQSIQRLHGSGLLVDDHFCSVRGSFRYPEGLGTNPENFRTPVTGLQAAGTKSKT